MVIDNIYMYGEHVHYVNDNVSYYHGIKVNYHVYYNAFE